jgi:glycosyltransferase involved in cell wall biosynthesis
VDRPKLSIVTCANRVNPYFDAAIQSLAAVCDGQSVQRVLVANGGWQPGEAIAKGFDLVVTTAESGLGHARNLGIERSAGEWVTFFDSDDLLDTQYVAATLAGIERHAEEAFFFNTTAMIAENGELMADWIPALQRYPDSVALRLAHPYTGATLVIRSDLFRHAGGYCWKGYAEDYELTLRLVFGHAGRTVPSRNLDAIYLYRQHGDTMSGNVRKKIEGVRAVQLHHLLRHRRWSMLLGVFVSTLRLVLKHS